ncbi:YkgJ family cysteine cluster protein [Paenibacillus sp. BSR1-1]|uniref:YkgJ family cysteine cluster protein n=1 Tax=Paenibacillus sp. BSR1-1 TaxID=3020845 RepID=UPI0025AF6B0A|nr:YkgJ family cysteine cluster protein [Paenibacillus sp. BSR1-1]MDN3016461.1 YkgJ family cysteine cluster protein [Paenibacillus sp. BSR1-1]
MNSLPCHGCKGLCCGPVPVTSKELKRIKTKIKTMPAKIRLNLQNQKRYYGTCIFYDLEKDRCGIHAARPDTCRKFGYYKHLVCFRNPAAATKEPEPLTEEFVGMLSVDFTWKDFR